MENLFSREEAYELERFIECSRGTLGKHTTLDLKLLDSSIKKLNLMIEECILGQEE